MTKTLYFDAFSGLSGDMTIGALLHLGLPLEFLQAELAKLELDGYRLEMRQAVKQYIAGVKLEVINEQHEHAHRGVSEIHRLIDRSSLAGRVKERAKSIFWNLAVAEGKIHGINPNEVHFHEVGALDAIVDIVGACIGFEFFQIEEFFCSPLPVGSGFVRAAHGLLPVPAPATLELLARAAAVLTPTVRLSGDIEYPARGEMVTPTGAAIVATLCKWERPALTLQKIGYGLGSKEFAWPNVLRLWLAERPTNAATPTHAAHTHEANHSHEHEHSHEPLPALNHRHTHEHADSPAPTPEAKAADTTPTEVVLLETNLDDMTPEGLGFLLEKLMVQEALDVFFTPIQMKKNRPAVKLSVLARPADAEKLAKLLLAESSAFGVRSSCWQRYIAGREFRQVEISVGTAQLKLKILDGQVVEAVPEYESVAKLARESGRSWREIYDEVKQAGTLTIN